LEDGNLFDWLFSGIDIEKDIKVCEVPFGGLILFNNMIPHRRYVTLLSL
jgi:hypothetical protein